MLSNPIFMFFKLIAEGFFPICPIFLDISIIREISSLIIEAHGTDTFLVLASMVEGARMKRCFLNQRRA
ncbi:hypothetical protein BSG1_14473 [Bacillus sp. SG-1]|nr:hypothetical protein BSG1_14473 [Bacillus sp. SG-1]